MPIYQHYSFDLWLTLIRSNPLFKSERALFFYNNFNYGSKSLEEVTLIFRQVDLMCNAINEKTGQNIDAEEMYLMVISAINDYSNPFQNIDTTALYNEMENLLFRHLPVIYCSETPGVLRHLKAEGGCSVSLLSNTGFIKGRTLRKILQQLELEHLFDFQLYSDETGMSKPNKRLFQLMLENVAETRKEKEIRLSEIIHIGDNPKADIEGAEAVGINSMLINSNQKTILSLLN